MYTNSFFSFSFWLPYREVAQALGFVGLNPRAGPVNVPIAPKHKVKYLKITNRALVAINMLHGRSLVANA